ncbi:MAG: MG2 domain-containing protein [Candidatus Eremiobacteraeota bacterium]|nr:MG2 domain-containing protein [Candidatus Eremiobacteraeota bacterium]
MVGFQADAAIPKATRIRVSVDASLTDRAGKAIGNGFAWTFASEPVNLTGLPGPHDEKAPLDDRPLATNPTFAVTSNVELDAASLAAATLFQESATGTRVNASAQFDKTATPEPGDAATQSFDPSLQTYVYRIKPLSILATGATYALVIASGVKPARGNLSSAGEFRGRFATYGALTFKGADWSSPGRFEQGDPVLRFNNGLDARSAMSAISLQPSPARGTKIVSLNDGDNSIAINSYALAPQTTYTINIGSGLKDQFGQTLGTAATATLRTSNLAADFWSPTGLNQFARSNSLQLQYSAVNLPDNRYRAAYRALAPPDIAMLSYDGIDQTNAPLPPPATWGQFTLAAGKNRIATIGVPVTEKLGAPTGFLAYGVQAPPHDRTTFYGIVGITNLGIFAQWFPQSASFLVQHVSDGSPAAGARVAIYREKTRAPCATGQTGAGGRLELRGIDIERCSAGAPAESAPSLIAVAREGADWTYARLNDSSGYGYDVYLGWSNGKPASRGTIFTDRQMYQPGERAAFTAVAYFLQNGHLRRDANAPYVVTLRDANGNLKNVGSRRTDRYGAFSIPWRFDANQPLGYYTIKAVGSNGNELYGDLRVAEFKPPNFNVTLALDKKYATPGAEITATGKSSYLFGAPLQGGRAQYNVTRSQAYLQPKGWDAFSFGKQWFLPDQAPSVGTEVLQQDATLDAAGRASQTVKVAGDLPFAMTYLVSMQVSDVSNLSVADSQSFMALPSSSIIGLQNAFVADEGKRFDVKVVVTDPDGKPFTGRHVHLDLQAMDYSAATQGVEGGDAARNSVKYTTVANADTTSSSTPQTVGLKASKAGAYRIRATFSGTASDASESDTQIWISGPDRVRWSAQNPSQVKITLDKATYKPGDLATALIQSPYPQADLYFSVVREKTLYHKLASVLGGAPRVTFRVTPDMLPNAAVQAVLVRRGKPLSKLAAGSLDSLVRIGFAAFSTNIDAKYLKLSIAPARSKVAPGQSQTVNFLLKTANGTPQRGELAVMVVNDSILQLTGYRLPDLVKTVYADQPISTRVSDSRPSVVLSPLSSPLGKGFGYGGGFMEGSGGTRVRRNFQQLAYDNGAVQTDASGKASVSFTLPDDLTTWRIMAVAVTAGDDFRFATNDATFVSTKPLIANPLLPQFARTGDNIEGGVALTNTTGTNGTVSLDAALGGALRFATEDSQTLHQQDRLTIATQAFRFPMSVGPGSVGTMQFKVALGAARDAFVLPLEIRNQAIRESTAQSGALPGPQPLDIPIRNNGTNGILELWLAGSIVPQIIVPAERVLREERGAFVENAASRLMVAATLQEVAVRTRQAPALNLAAEVTGDLAEISKLQNDDGGLSAWPGAKSDALLTAYAAGSLGAAKHAGYAVSASLSSSVTKYLSAVLADPAKKSGCKATPCKAFIRLNGLIALSALGDTRSDFLSDIYAARDTLDFSGRARLAHYLLQFPNWRSNGEDLTRKLSENLYFTARNANANIPSEWSWFGSSRAAQAELLSLLVATHASSDIIDNLVRSATVTHCTCPFIDTYATALRLSALLDYLRTQPASVNFDATVKLGAKVTHATFHGTTAGVKHMRFAGSALRQTPATLKLSKNGTGTLHYEMVYAYQLSGTQPGMLAGLRVTRMVHPANEDTVLAQMGLVIAPVPVTLAASRVFDVALEIITDHPVDHVMITDPIPAGLEAVDTTFQTSIPNSAVKNTSWQIDYQTIYKDRIFAFADRLNAGVYSFHYTVRSVTPGTYAWPGAEAHLQYAPEEFGRTAAATLTVSP